MLKTLLLQLQGYWQNNWRGIKQTPHAISADSFTSKIEGYLKAKNIRLDSQQQQTTLKLNLIYQQIHHIHKKNTHVGLYLWGDVGTGKTLLMDMLYHISEVPKIRLHHHELFKKLMHDLHYYKNSVHPLKSSIKAFTQQYRLAYFDDLHLNDIADAKLWQGLFNQAKKNGLIMLITSNTHPKNLMDTPGYREKINPLISAMQTHLIISQVDAGIDYRTMQYHHKLPQHSACLNENQRDAFYHSLTQQNYQADNTHTLTIGNRPLLCHSYHNRYIFFALEQLCGSTCSYTDYIELCERFDCISIITFNHDLLTNALSLQRFIWLIDIIYDKNKRFFVITNHNPINTLKAQTHPSLKRVISRLQQLF